MMSGKRKITGVFLFLFLVLFLFLHEVTVFAIRLPDRNNEIHFLESVKEGDEIVLTYRHSVEKTLVRGIFRVSSTPSLQAKETWMTSVGTGLPNTFSDRTRQEGKWLIVDEGLSEIENFRFFISPVNKTRLSTPSGAVDLTRLSAGTIILLDIESMSLMRYGGYEAGFLCRDAGKRGASP